jgi:hypothetical protein
MIPVFTLLTDYAQQYGIVKYEDSTYGACNVSYFNPPGNSNPDIPFTGITIPTDPGSPSQEGHLLAWSNKANNMLGRTYSTFNEAKTQLHQVLGGIHELGIDGFALENNPFKDQFTHSDFPEGYEV